MSFYRWCMRYGAAILFIIAGLTLVLNLIGVFQLMSESTQATSFETGVSNRPAELLLIIRAVLGAFGAAALPFFGALLINRLDIWLGARTQAEPFE